MTRNTMIRGLKEGKDPLKLSIRKWKDIIEGKGEDEGGGNCALCKVYYQEDGNCSSCPASSEKGCCNGLYGEYSDRMKEKRGYDAEITAEGIVKFLEGLRK